MQQIKKPNYLISGILFDRHLSHVSVALRLPLPGLTGLLTPSACSSCYLGSSVEPKPSYLKSRVVPTFLYKSPCSDGSDNWVTLVLLILIQHLK
jgi:hypothetical protein